MVFKTTVPQTPNKRMEIQKGVLGPSIKSRTAHIDQAEMKKRVRGVGVVKRSRRQVITAKRQTIRKERLLFAGVEIWVPVTYRREMQS